MPELENHVQQATKYICCILLAIYVLGCGTSRFIEPVFQGLCWVRVCVYPIYSWLMVKNEKIHSGG